MRCSAPSGAGKTEGNWTERVDSMQAQEQMAAGQEKTDRVQGLVDQWLAIDVNPHTRRQVLTLAQNVELNCEKLNDMLSERIVFGTAGLRARMEAGFNRMNDVTVVQASQGLAEYMKTVAPAPEQWSIVIGHDHRFNSKRFAELTVAVFLVKGFKVFYIGPDDCATPMVPFAVDHYKALGGIMITASHNPKDDNGYKVYWSNGCQIIPPHDVRIQNEILKNLDPVLDPGTLWSTEEYLHSERLTYCHREVADGYSAHLLDVLKPAKLSDFKYVYTAMHGVGYTFVSRLTESFTTSGNFVPVPEQCKPDPNFPTVSFPNPEEKNALDLAIQTADRLDINLVVANDPDADRFSAAVKSSAGKWRQLSGNELGLLFADFIIESRYIAKSLPLSNVYILNSTVSSQMIGSMARELGFNFEDTLTGFKWIGNKAIELEKQGFCVPFAYEEAIGFMFPTVHDKDGISALLVFLQLYDALLKQGITPLEKLELLCKRFGYFKQCNGYYVTPHSDVQSSIFNENIRTKDRPYPTTVGKYKVETWRDLTTGFDSTTSDNKPRLHVDPTSQMITCKLSTAAGADNADEFIRLTARGSGTEPKLKVYIEARASNEARASFLAGDVWATLRREWFKPVENKLVEKLV